jgi:hypothetical protein
VHGPNHLADLPAASPRLIETGRHGDAETRDTETGDAFSYLLYARLNPEPFPQAGQLWVTIYLTHSPSSASILA